MRSATRIILGSTASAVLLVLALPPANVGLTGWICLTPLFWSVIGQGFLAGFIGGLGTALGAAFLSQSGMLYANKWSGGSPDWIYLGFVLYGIVITCTSVILSEERSKPNSAWIAARSLAIEGCLTIVLPAHIALTQWQNPAALSLAALTGIWGVSFLVWWVNIGLATFLKNHELPSCVPVSGFVLALAWLIRPGTVAPIRTLAVGLVQCDESDEDVLKKLHSQVANADITVWPELAGMIFAPGGDTKQLAQLASKTSSSFVTSYEEPGKPLSANVARIFSPAGISNGYVKRKPFAGERQFHRAGTTAVAVHFAARDGQQISAGLNICFDTCYPWIMRDTSKLIAGPGIILVPTEDPPTLHGVVQSLHASYTTFRAAELALPIVRADTSGFSMAVSDRGEVLGSMGIGDSAASVQVPLRRNRWTLYKSIGEWFLWLDIAALCWYFTAHVWSRRAQNVR